MFVSVVDYIKVRFARAEDELGFSVFGGSPVRLVDFLSSGD